jgi:phosphohistidine phosphatase SixA
MIRLNIKVLPLQSILLRCFQLAVLLILINVTFPTLKTVSAADHTTAVLYGQDLVQALRTGGYSIYFRHEATEWSQMDDVQKADDWLSCDGARIRQLSTGGRQSAKNTGRSIQSLAIPIGQIFASPYCRTVETAKLMGLGEVEPINDVINLRVAEYFGGPSAVVATARKLLAQSPPTNFNTIIVAHGNVARASTLIYPDEGEGVVFEADGEGDFRFIGRLSPTEWQSLAETLKP